MSGRSQQRTEGNNTPRESPPLEYVNPDQENPENEDGLPGGGPEDPNGPDDPNDPGDPDGPDGPDGGPDPNDDDPDDEPEPDPSTLFLDALHDLSSSLRTLRRPQPPKQEKIKVREPDTFDGTNPRKLRDFLVSCNLHFRDRSDVFASDEKRILFILSYLKGSALSWFEPGLNDPTNSAHWMWDYQAFLSELEDNFGPHDPVGDAEKSLSELVMKKTAKIMKYNVDFWELASRVSWNEAALRDRYFRGLPLRLRTEVLRGGKPQTLAQLRLKAQDADNIYWMQEEETRIESKNTGGSDRNSGKKDSKGSSNSNNNSNNNSNSNNQSKSQSSSNNGNSASSGSNAGNKGSSSKDKPKNSISDKLGKNGKLVGEERERRLKEGLCLYCGEKGHIAHDCPKSKAAKARAATVTAESKSDSADSKK